MLYVLHITALQLKYYSPPPLIKQDTKFKGVIFIIAIIVGLSPVLLLYF